MEIATSDHNLALGSLLLDYALRRTMRKTLGITVFPDGKILVTAPVDAEHDQIEARLKKRKGWILKTLREFEQFRPRTPDRLYQPGETHRYLGRQYRLKISQDIKSSVVIAGDRIAVSYPHTRSPDRTAELLRRWYQIQARKLLVERLAVNMKNFHNLVVPPKLTVRKLTKRWGSMSATGDHMLLNTKLIEAPLDCIDYVIVHEMCHIAEPHHGSAFFDLLEQKMPDWERRKLRLERSMM